MTLCDLLSFHGNRINVCGKYYCLQILIGYSMSFLRVVNHTQRRFEMAEMTDRLPDVPVSHPRSSMAHGHGGRTDVDIG